ncbi:LutC/YkgG family protein [Acidihalobacter ferrooxydans]|uniref:LUD domain-containing protein n=1 Tax=Acidihalobacter ferrooxydans TaxID=1765967 RepID=A0A1P8UG25_9GAMM|nr:LUD domain-containing protein [Acidihalobacter ferrooxydans]APZ42792.1 hypothetical protein BW247_06545 [Acidihalobacter ferrooxydans]
MTDARRAIIARLRASLGDADIRRPAVEQRLNTAPRGPTPAVGEDLVAAFTTRVEAAAASMVRIRDGAGVVAEVLDYLAQRELPQRLLLADDPWLRKLPWPTSLRVDIGAAAPDHLAGLTRAYAGIAETGSLALLSGLATPTGANFLPDHYLCLLRTEDIVRHLEDLWARLRTESIAMPRALNLITGPSRTGDVEQTIQLGAHGPRSVRIILLDGCDRSA